MAYNKEYYEKNKEAIKKSIKKWNDKNKDKIQAYRQSHKEEINEYNRNWRANNKDKVQGYTESSKQRRAEWRLLHPDRIAEYQATRKESMKKEKELLAGILATARPALAAAGWTELKIMRASRFLRIRGRYPDGLIVPELSKYDILIIKGKAAAGVKSYEVEKVEGIQMDDLRQNKAPDSSQKSSPPSESPAPASES